MAIKTDERADLRSHIDNYSQNMMDNINTSRIAWLLPSMGTNKRQGYPWHSVLSEFTKLFPDTTIFTGEWAWICGRI